MRPPRVRPRAGGGRRRRAPAAGRPPVGEDGGHLLLGPHAVAGQLEASPQAVRRVLVAAGAGPRAAAVAAGAAAAGVRVEEVPSEALAARAEGRPHQSIAAIIAPVPTVALADLLARGPALLVALDGVEDPHNLGAIMRTAWALGADGLVLPERRSAPLGAAALRAAAGAHAHLAICRVVNLGRALASCQAAGMWVVGTAADAARRLDELSPPPRRVLVIGGEGRGLRPGVAAHCDLVGAIAQRAGSGSLNASVACGIALVQLAAGRGGRLDSGGELG